VPVDVGVLALRGNFHLLHRASQSSNDVGAYLLRFYAVECGLKAALLLRSNARSTKQLPAHLRNHDLRALASALKLPPATLSGIAPCGRHDAQQAPVEPHQVHEAWRYGARLVPDAEKTFVTGLDSLIAWCLKELQR